MAYVTQQIIKTTEGWATFDALGKPVPKDYWLFERVTETVGDITQKYYKFKLSDGVSLFADLSYQLLNGHSASINEAGNWLVYDDATQVYKDSGVKAIGVNGKSAFELWQALEGNADKTLVDFFIYLKGEKGDAFTFDDFTIEQLALLKGASAYQVWKAQDGNEDKTVDEYLQYIKGAPFTYADFTQEQIITITGKSAYQIWLDQPGNEGKTIEQYLISIKGQDGQSAYLDAVAKGYAGTKDEFDTLLAGISSGGGYLDISFLFDINGDPVTSITQKQLDLIVKAYNNKVSAVFWKKSVLPAAIYTSASGYNIAVSDIGYDKGVTHVSTLTLEITTINLSVHFKLGENDFESSGDGSKVLSDNGSYQKIFDIPNVDAPKDEYRYSRQGGGWKRSAYYLGHLIIKLKKTSSSADISAAIGGKDGFMRLLSCLTSYTPVFIATGDFYTGSLTPVAITGGAIMYKDLPLDIYITSTETLYNNPLSKMVMRTVKRKIGRNEDFSTFFYEEESAVSGLDLYDVFTVTALTALSPTKYSQKFTYTTTTVQAINFSSAPAEGFECMLDILNSTASSITQIIPNAANWQCEDTYLVIPAGKVGNVSIRYIHGKYCVRVGL